MVSVLIDKKCIVPFKRKMAHWQLKLLYYIEREWTIEIKIWLAKMENVPYHDLPITVTGALWHVNHLGV